MPDFTPYFQRIIIDITAQIKDGRLPPGSRLPSTAQLAEQYEVSSSTVRVAIRILLDDGVLRGHQGVAVFVADAPPVT